MSIEISSVITQVAFGVFFGMLAYRVIAEVIKFIASFFFYINGIAREENEKEYIEEDEEENQ